MKKALASLVLISMILSFFPAGAFASAPSDEILVHAHVEPYFIESPLNKRLSDGELISFQGRSYIREKDLTTFVQQNQNALAATTPFLPKKSFHAFHDAPSFWVPTNGYAAFTAKNNAENVMFSKNGDARLYPSSTTKIMTLLLALKYGTLTDDVTLSSAVERVPSDSSKANVKRGDRMTLEQLLYALILPSGNDAAMAVAEHISGSVSAFVALMNREAKQLGATSTNFTNPHGYHHSNLYTTASDVAKITFAALEFEDAKRIMGEVTYRTTYHDHYGRPVTKKWKSTNHQLNPSSPFYTYLSPNH